MKTDSSKAVLAAFLSNLGIAIAKLFGFFITGAASMLAESIHSFADTSNQALLFLGGRLAVRDENEEHPFGFGRERYFWSFIVAQVIFLLGSLFALYEGISKFIHPHKMESPLWAVGILILGIGLEGWSFLTAVKASNKIRGKASWWEFVRRAKVPELPVILLEDLGALIGLALALMGIIAAMITGDPRYDALGSAAIGVLLFAIAAILAVEMRSLLLGESATKADRESIREVITSDQAVVKLIHMRTQHLGPEELLLGIKVEMSAKLSFSEVVEAINALEVRLREKVPITRIIYIEPDIYRPDKDERRS